MPSATEYTKKGGKKSDANDEDSYVSASSKRGKPGKADKCDDKPDCKKRIRVNANVRPKISATPSCEHSASYKVKLDIKSEPSCEISEISSKQICDDKLECTFRVALKNKYHIEAKAIDGICFTPVTIDLAVTNKWNIFCADGEMK